MEITDLVNACKEGSASAQQELYLRYSDAMFNTCLRIVGNRQDAEDLLQVAFTKVFLKIKTFRGESTIGAWIKKIVVNLSLNHIKRNRVFFEEVSEMEDTHVEPIIEENQLSVEKIKGAMNLLPDGYRLVFSLYLLEGYDHSEIASILKISEATSKSQYSRAKRKIKELLKVED
ncbi:MAG: hypothetical protein RLZZ248_654 [Bacteroidota bacterium]